MGWVITFCFALVAIFADLVLVQRTNLLCTAEMRERPKMRGCPSRDQHPSFCYECIGQIHVRRAPLHVSSGPLLFLAAFCLADVFQRFISQRCCCVSEQSRWRASLCPLLQLWQYCLWCLPPPISRRLSLVCRVIVGVSGRCVGVFR